MESLTNTAPKCLLKVKGKTLLDWQLEAIKGAGIKEVAIVTGYKKESLSQYSLIEFNNPNWGNSQMVYSLFCAREWFSGDSCVISYSDIFYNKSAIKLLKNNNDDISITYDPNWRILWGNRFSDPLSDAESFRLNHDHTVSEIGNKVNSINNIEGQYMGLIKISEKGWSHFKELFDSQDAIQQKSLDMTALFKLVLKANKHKIHAYPYNQIWGEVDNKNDLNFYNKSI